MVSVETPDILGPAPAMFETKVGRGRGLSHLIPVQQKKHVDFFIICRFLRNPSAKTKTKTQAETQTRKHAQDPLLANTTM